MRDWTNDIKILPMSFCRGGSWSVYWWVHDPLVVGVGITGRICLVLNTSPCRLILGAENPSSPRPSFQEAFSKLHFVTIVTSFLVRLCECIKYTCMFLTVERTGMAAKCHVKIKRAERATRFKANIDSTWAGRTLHKLRSYGIL
ncbi:hypothetical protein KIL84_016161 [Mauremys mutica]|uniref:Uncharacterized protein n=1 Tax=Mauremys mutica TaxID=74926 RepID=A0A9D3WN25_9SAUR|nr:hypothetical protein KIL84_016161 [Mauremys mutica]